uniref:Homeobox domain-containing protein n=1 Tax=Zea mays TaxID=4577 RepID=A0A804NRF1_MAIZE
MQPISFRGGEERTPDPKPRWNPRPEQIRILEAIFNSGMVNPPREEIPRIRMRLQEYDQVGDANFFYWFQNRKSRSKNKLRTGH